MMNPQQILDTSKPLNVELFDQVVQEFYQHGSNKQVHDILAQFERDPRAWTKAPDIIQKSSQIESKILALSVLEGCIKTRWNILPVQSKKGIKGFVESLVVKLSQDPNLKDIGPFLTKLNTVLIEIIKREWPHNWPGFITQVVEVSKRSEIVCANNMNLLRLLSEEAFENRSLHLSHQQVDNFKENLTKELSKVFELCMFVLKNSAERRLIENTLITMHKFLAIKWIPIDIVFSSQLIEALTLKYFNMEQHRVITLQCLVEIAGIKRGEYDKSGSDTPRMEGQAPDETVSTCNDKLVNMFLTILRKTFSECGLNLNTNIDAFICNNQANYLFVQTYTNFFFNFLRWHHRLLEDYNNGSRDGLKAALSLLLNISNANDSTLFGICCDLWEYLVRDLQRSLPKKNLLNSTFQSHAFSSPSSASSSSAHSPPHNQSTYDINHPRYELYREALHSLKQVLMRRLPRPKEVLVVKDENGAVVKQEMKDTFMLTLHQQMSKILYILSSIDPADTRKVIGDKLTAFSSTQEAKRRYGGSSSGQSDAEENQFFAELNSLCWSIGAVAGSMPPDVEKSFLVVVIKILLSLCEVQQSKNAKAIIASCIMYVVRKYPRFLKKHWKFLQTVVRKLIEFLAEKHPGVQDMSIETLNEICLKCGQKFLKIQENDADIFLVELVHGLDDMTLKLSLEQIENLYATWAVIIAHEKRDYASASGHVEQLLSTPNARYQQLLTTCQSTEDFSAPATVEKYVHLLRIYKGVCQHCSGDGASVNGAFLLQFTNLYPSLIKLYTGYAQLMSQWYTANPSVPRSAAPPYIKLMSTLKSEILTLFQVFVAKSMKRDYDQIVEKFVPNFLNAILTDYTQCNHLFKEYACLNVCSALIECLDTKMNPFVPQMFGTLFQVTLDMIKESMDNFPDHRLALFKFLYHVNKSCFAVFEQMNKTQMQLVINCIMWAHEHIDPSICDFGVKTLNQFLSHIRRITQNNHDGTLMTMFYQNFLFLILQKLMSVMTDTLHKSSFGAMCNTLQSICVDLNGNPHLGQLYDANAAQSNREYVATQLCNFLQQQFAHLTPAVIQEFVFGLFQLANAQNARTDELVMMSTPTKHTNNASSATAATTTTTTKTQSNAFVQHCEDFLVAIRSVHRSTNAPQQTPQAQSNGHANGVGAAPATAVGNGAMNELNDDDL
eukprot:CAMPEP_0202687500 /NCGR_PEP_ID=MMETSP1385-20130828/3167_1 /ASSEMBLY_ACC=CAM_ASM_000861 /TAXON_ID=933848 /ORGANISM="Elphidium margaritaceum" /LENGTH=1175 /DNA_ID=CAMNT_0049342305 /DNA_START=97 /DNA_END=3624 /DNA_ORIENTATION=+